MIEKQSLDLSRRRACMAGISSLLGSAWPVLAQAQSDKPAKIILPVSSGSGVDAIVRAANQALSKSLGQPVAIDNQPGAGGVVGTHNLVRAVPDGQTLGVVSNNHVIYPSVLKSVPFDPVADITPIAVMVTTPMVLVVNPKLPVKTLKELIALLKANPGKYNYASSGNGTILQLGMELFKEASGTFVTHIPYRGTGPMVTDIMGGQIDMGVVALPAVLGQIKAGTLRALCVASPQRSANAPDIPTSAQADLPGFIVEGWAAAVGPKGLSADAVRRIHQAFATAYATPEVKDAMAKQGNTVVMLSPEASKSHFTSELKKYAAIVKRAGVVAQ